MTTSSHNSTWAELRIKPQVRWDQGAIAVQEQGSKCFRHTQPLMIALRVFLPGGWTNDATPLKRACVQVEYRTRRSKLEMAFGRD